MLEITRLAPIGIPESAQRLIAPGKALQILIQVADLLRNKSSSNEVQHKWQPNFYVNI